MNTTRAQKYGQLAATLLRSPRDWWPYVWALPLWGRQPAQLEIPWFSYDAIRYLKAYLKPHHQVFEYGSGGSTFFFGRRAGRVTSVENDAQWHGLVSSLLRRRKLSNVTYELHGLADDRLETFRASPFSQRIQSAMWDVVVVDCHCGFNAAPYGLLRPDAFLNALGQVKPGGIIVLDDSWMYRELLQPRPGWVITDFVGVGPCRYGVTSTAIFRYEPDSR